ncbi:hypothetical protein TMatcc_002377 [Talaromyces marneffei ATCC 18224]
MPSHKCAYYLRPIFYALVSSVERAAPNWKTASSSRNKKLVMAMRMILLSLCSGTLAAVARSA